MDRRNFIQNSTIASAGLILSPTLLKARTAFDRLGASDKIRFATIGCKGQGWADTTAMLKTGVAECVAICDIDDAILAQRKGDLEKLGGKADTYKDFRKVLDRKDVDAVIVGTPDHWHALIMIQACMAGKDVFCEKPLASTIDECNAMVAATQKYGRAVQVGQWQRSQKHFKDAVAYIQSGKLGDISAVRTWNARKHPNLPIVPDTAVPDGVDYKMWLGPAPNRAFNANRFHYTFRWFWDYAGGLMTDWGVHLLDIPMWALSPGEPKRIMSSGGKWVFPTDARETPDVQTTIYEFDKMQLTWEHSMATASHYTGKSHGIAFCGQHGSLVLNRGGWEVLPEGKEIEAVAWTKSSDNGLDLHAINWAEVIKSRNFASLNCPIGEAAKVARISSLGNAALRVGKPIEWNAATQKTDNKQANKILYSNYQNGWKLPVS